MYLGCHEVLEYDDLKLFSEMGWTCFSLGGAYQNSNKGIGALRGEIPSLEIQQDLTINPQTKDNIHPDLLKWADVILMTHNVPDKDHPQPWLNNNWEKFKEAGKPVIWRGIGQSNKIVEQSLEKFRKDGLKIVRYSPKESLIPNYQGSDAVIRFYCDPSLLDGYTGMIPRIVNISQGMFGGPSQASRGDHMNLTEFKMIVKDFDWKIFGPGNEKAGEHNGGKLDYGDLKSMMRFNRLFLSVGTRPASYTLAFMDAFMLGIPIVAIGPKLANSSIYKELPLYEVHELIGTSGEAGFWSNDINELKEYCKTLLADQTLAQTIGAKGRVRAISLFSRDLIMGQWKEFFESL